MSNSHGQSPVVGVRIIYLRCIGHQVPSIKRPFPSLPSPRTGIVGNRRHKCSAFLLGRCDGLVALLLYNLDIAPPAIARVLRQPSFPSRLSRIRVLACGYLELAAGHTCARLLDQYAIGSAACTASSEASSPGTSIRAFECALRHARLGCSAKVKNQSAPAETRETEEDWN